MHDAARGDLMRNWNDWYWRYREESLSTCAQANGTLLEKSEFIKIRQDDNHNLYEDVILQIE
ncbi:hypothetical protein [Paenibacillus taihuensis]|nr:hypothetical protein [Paenibacillus taihuensis]